MAGTLFLLAVFLLAVGFNFYRQIYYSEGKNLEPVNLKIYAGENIWEIADVLKREKLVSGKIYFVYYVFKNNLRKKILAGEYVIPVGMKIPDLAVLLSEGEAVSKKEIKITFPEGLTLAEMEKKITEVGLNGEDFSALASSADSFRNDSRYPFLNDIPVGGSLEGYLFPDTYFFYPNDSANVIIEKMLDNFGKKVGADLIEAIKNQDKTLREIIIMASLIEKEVRSDDDRALVAGIFWKRIENNFPLQSCATLAYALGENKKQYSYADTQIASPFNTYIHTGLPLAPISNPGLSSLRAAIYPRKSDYNFFLSDPETGATVFSKTLEEHNLNKQKHGL